ncbi:MAG: ACT domain-containing protein [Actinobacteria bacterium]|nr:ACT domain-containing protein [Actinomycetota bacterium]
MTQTYILRVWMPDRPGALGALASRIGAVGGDVTGIDILERGAGRAIDELVVELPDDALVELLVTEIHQVDGVDIESIRPAAEALHDPRVDALETAALLVGAPTPSAAIEELCVHGVRTVGAHWGAVLDLADGSITSQVGDCPSAAWIAAFVAGSQSSARVSDGDAGPSDVVWAPLPAAGRALVMGRNGESFRARERRQAAALARIVDTRFRELTAAARQQHPSVKH